MARRERTEAEKIARNNTRAIRKLRDDIDELCEAVAETHEILVDIAYLLAPVIYDVRTKGKYPAKSMSRVANLMRENKRGDMTKLERAFWTGDKVE